MNHSFQPILKSKIFKLLKYCIEIERFKEREIITDQENNIFKAVSEKNILKSYFSSLYDYIFYWSFEINENI